MTEPAGRADALLESYPRARPPLPEAHRRIFEAEYKANREGRDAASSLAQRAESWMHRRVAVDPAYPTLELGAGTLNHLPYEAAEGDYDVVEPMASLLDGSPALARVRDRFSSLHEIDPARRYRRIVSVAVLEHMEDLPRDVARAGLLLAEGGRFCAGIPAEGGFAWGLGWRVTTGLSFRLRNRLDYGAVMRHEHLSTDLEILAVVRHFFESVRVWRFPLPLRHASLYAALEATGPRLSRCRERCAAAPADDDAAL
ncbi:MAG: class I SAM-dependent methyltransferase [Myxococcales bacterium]|nr:class I SAM-dependent methyltransferase [Myxococcales bacterium]